MRFSGGTTATELLAAAEILRELDATGACKVPDKRARPGSSRPAWTYQPSPYSARQA